MSAGKKRRRRGKKGMHLRRGNDTTKRSDTLRSVYDGFSIEDISAALEMSASSVSFEHTSSDHTCKTRISHAQSVISHARVNEAKVFSTPPTSLLINGDFCLIGGAKGGQACWLFARTDQGRSLCALDWTWERPINLTSVEYDTTGIIISTSKTKRSKKSSKALLSYRLVFQDACYLPSSDTIVSIGGKFRGLFVTSNVTHVLSLDHSMMKSRKSVSNKDNTTTVMMKESMTWDFGIGARIARLKDDYVVVTGGLKYPFGMSIYQMIPSVMEDPPHSSASFSFSMKLIYREKNRLPRSDGVINWFSHAFVAVAPSVFVLMKDSYAYACRISNLSDDDDNDDDDPTVPSSSDHPCIPQIDFVRFDSVFESLIQVESVSTILNSDHIRSDFHSFGCEFDPINGHLYIVGGMWDQRPSDAVYVLTNVHSLIHSCLGDDCGLFYPCWVRYPFDLPVPMALPSICLRKSSLHVFCGVISIEDGKNQAIDSHLEIPLIGQSHIMTLLWFWIRKESETEQTKMKMDASIVQSDSTTILRMKLLDRFPTDVVRLIALFTPLHT